MHHDLPDLPAEVIERIIDAPGVSSHRETLLACSEVGRAWHVRSMVHLFRVLEVVHGEAQNSWRWYSSQSPESGGRAKEEAFIRVTPDELLDQLLTDYVHLVRYVQHLLISSGFGDGDDGPNPHANLLMDPRFRFPKDHRITRLTVTGSAFYIPDPHEYINQDALLGNFNKLTQLRMSGVHFIHAGCFTGFLSIFKTLRNLDLSYSHIHGNIGHRTCEKPTFLRPVNVVLRPDVNSLDSIGVALAWMETGGTMRFGEVSLDAVIPSDANERNLYATVLSAPKISRGLISVLKLNLVWQRWTAAKNIVALLPNLRRAHITIRDGWHITSDTMLARILSSDDLIPGADHERSNFTNSTGQPRDCGLEELVIILEAGSPPTRYLSSSPWANVADVLEQPHWQDLKSCILRLRASERIPSLQKRSLRQGLESVWKGTKLRLCIDDSNEIEELTDEFATEDVFTF